MTKWKNNCEVSLFGWLKCRAISNRDKSFYWNLVLILYLTIYQTLFLYKNPTIFLFIAAKICTSDLAHERILRQYPKIKKYCYMTLLKFILSKNYQDITTSHIRLVNKYFYIFHKEYSIFNRLTIKHGVQTN